MSSLKELPTTRHEFDDTPQEVFVLTVVEGPDAGLRNELDPTAPVRVLLGKSVTSNFRLSDGGVSRRHASIRPDGNKLIVTDLDSTNGTRVNGVAVREATLHGGEAILVGRTTISVTRGSPSFATLSEEDAFGRLLGGSRAMRRLYPILHRLADKDDPVLIEGETGVGKELCAEELHLHSPRKERPFLVLSCQALPSSELEARLLGEGGLVKQAAGGSVFVDEVVALPIALQRHLASTWGTLEARVLFGTRWDLDQAVGDGTFSESLLGRIAPTRVELPPLRHREGDLPQLARAFWEALVSAQEPAVRDADDPSGRVGQEVELPSDFLVRFHRYRWPGNVRELWSAITARFDNGALARWRAADGPGGSRAFLDSVVDRELPLTEARQIVVEEFERRYVEHMLSRHGSTKEAANASGVGVRYLQILRARLGL